MIKKKHVAPPTSPPSLSGRFSPRYCPIITVTPVVRELTVKVTRFIMLLPVVTPDIPSVVPNLPTIIRSTAPYIACKINAPSTGSMNPIIFFGILPVVKSCFSFIYLFTLLSLFLSYACFSLFFYYFYTIFTRDF